MKAKTFCKTIIAVALATSVVGCSTMQDMGNSIKNMDKSQIGATVGALAGGIACYAMLGKASTGYKIAGTGACAGIAGLIGHSIGQTLEDRDKAELQAKVQTALNSPKAGTTTWKSSTSGATAKIEVGKPETRREEVSLKYREGVQPVGQMNPIGAKYMAVKGANIRSATSTSAPILGDLRKGAAFTAIGKSGDWILIGRNGVVDGYVSSSLVQSKASVEAKLAKQMSSSKSTTVAATNGVMKAEPKIEVKPVIDLDEVTPEAAPELAKVLAAKPTITGKVSSETTCRTITSTVTDDKGVVENQSDQSCKKVAEESWTNA